MPRKQAEKVDFEASLEQLSQIVKVMEQGDLSLEDALKYFEQGIKLTHQCQSALQKAEQKVKILMEENKEGILEPYEDE
ncbi:MAG: exodeoxyribonuclease VII small subunit [Gammaproteobacteria bacterium]